MFALFGGNMCREHVDGDGGTMLKVPVLLVTIFESQ